jgi:hypothetical protein
VVTDAEKAILQERAGQEITRGNPERAQQIQRATRGAERDQRGRGKK